MFAFFVEDTKPISVLEQFGFTIVFPWGKKKLLLIPRAMHGMVKVKSLK